MATPCIPPVPRSADGSALRCTSRRYDGKRLPVPALCSITGYYIDTSDNGDPTPREAFAYVPTRDLAVRALVTGCWTQRFIP